ncbi:MAG: hypothetical protein M3680_30725, partial [Myxococcota bacterium]|nr:hypothetical protein [Myxococcota bacterium]
LILRGLPGDAERTTAQKAAMTAAMTAAAPVRLAGDLVVGARWTGGADLDVSLITPDGVRVSWMGGRTDVTVVDATSTEREQLAVKRLKRGTYLLELTRNGGSGDVLRGSLDITALGGKTTLPFELTGARSVVGRVAIKLDSRLEPVTFE